MIDKAPSTFTLEPMRIDHLPQVMAIEREAFSSPWTKSMFLSELWENPFSFSYVAKEEGGRVVGYVCFWIVVDELHLLNIAVHPRRRRTGVGADLFRLALRMGRERAARIATLEVRLSNLPALDLYRKFGFREVGRRPNYYHDPPEDALLLQCDLAPAALEGNEDF
ncbi:MAG TPA: ribosomal protein S18-alanine N-acetyltransferase [Candidatus Manganitrophaceae bacterium]|nr:ribosomal protein S18-alanine N-acetyltransferase [Candidatus Manganitrophaceae bacterium]